MCSVAICTFCLRLSSSLHLSVGLSVFWSTCPCDVFSFAPLIKSQKNRKTKKKIKSRKDNDIILIKNRGVEFFDCVCSVAICTVVFFICFHAWVPRFLFNCFSNSTFFLCTRSIRLICQSLAIFFNFARSQALFFFLGFTKSRFELPFLMLDVRSGTCVQHRLFGTSSPRAPPNCVLLTLYGNVAEDVSCGSRALCA